MLYRVLAGDQAIRLNAASGMSYAMQTIAINPARVLSSMTLTCRCKADVGGINDKNFHLYLIANYSAGVRGFYEIQLDVGTYDFKDFLLSIPSNGRTAYALTLYASMYMHDGTALVKDISLQENGNELLSNSWSFLNASVISLPAMVENYGDYTLGQGKQGFVSGADAVAQAIYTRLKILKGEWWEDTSLGVPLFQSILGKTGSPENLKAVDLIVQNTIRNTPGVTAIKNFSSSLENRTYKMSCTVNTEYGEASAEVTF